MKDREVLHERDLKAAFRALEEEVSSIKDPVLRKAAFEKLVDNLLATHKKDRVGFKKQTKRVAVAGKKEKPIARKGRPGPREIVTQLLTSGYFDKPKLLADIRTYIKHTMGHTYSGDELSITLTRLLREGLLSREKKEKGPYHWKKP